MFGVARAVGCKRRRPRPRPAASLAMLRAGLVAVAFSLQPAVCRQCSWRVSRCRSQPAERQQRGALRASCYRAYSVSAQCPK